MSAGSLFEELEQFHLGTPHLPLAVFLLHGVNDDRPIVAKGGSLDFFGGLMHLDFGFLLVRREGGDLGHGVLQLVTGENVPRHEVGGLDQGRIAVRGGAEKIEVLRAPSVNVRPNDCP